MVFYKSVLFLFMIFFACMETNPEAQNNPAKMQATFSADRSEDQVEIQDAEKIFAVIVSNAGAAANDLFEFRH